MNRRKRFPRLANLENEDIRLLLRRSSLSRLDRHIAINCLCWDMADADNAAAVYATRSTVGRHLNNTIVPQLEKLMLRYISTEHNESVGA